MSGRAPAWLAWSLALLLGGLSMSYAAVSSAPELLSDGGWDPLSVVITLATVLTFSVVGAVVASRHPRNTIGWLFSGTGLMVGLGAITGGYAELWLASNLDGLREDLVGVVEETMQPVHVSVWLRSPGETRRRGEPLG